MERKKKKRKDVEPLGGAKKGNPLLVKSARLGGHVQRSPISCKTFPIVGLGASAGGLEALEKFLAQVPPDCGIAFVIVTHLHPGHVSLLPELLGKCTRMPLRQAADGLVVEPNTVYMSLPEGYLAILQGTLHVMPDEPGLLRLPIDYFFRSLAEDQRDRAIGIILSGTGTDGTLGLKAIKGAAGMTMAQEPDSAKYSGMPASAINTGLVDYILPVERLPQKLVAYTQGPYLSALEPELGEEGEGLSEPMHKIIVLLRARAGHDFSVYKANTIRRRIERRINVHQLEGPLQYLRLLSDNPHELDLLFRELLIGVTNFFRDAEAFTALAKTVVPRLLEGRPDNLLLRVWVTGCSTGEEAYSLAMLLQEGMDKSKRPFPVQVFGTDLDAEAIDIARRGLYPEGIARDVGPQRLARFFLKEDDGYRIKKEIRDLVIFAPQNVLKDPPFTKLDLVACRNLLIYVQSAQEARADAESIAATVREPLLVLDDELCVVSANRAFHQAFKTSARKVERQLIYELSGGQWNLPGLRELLEEVLSRDHSFEGFKVEQTFPGLGPRTLLLNAQRLKREPGAPEMIWLAFEDATARPGPEKKLRAGKKAARL